MKKIKYLFIVIVSIFAFNINVFAASGSLSISSENVYVGDSFTVTANINSAAAWNVHVTTSGPVSGCSINQADTTSDAMDTNKTFSSTCTTTGTGTIIVVLSGDVTSASDGNAVNISESKSVTVSQKITPPTNSNNNSNNNNSNNTNSNNNNSNNNNNQLNNDIDNRSKNNNIKELLIDGYDLVKVDANNYTLSVSNDVTSINIEATAEDSKSKVTGTGNHDINIGENNIEVIITAENGLQNKINIKVTRKDGYYLEDLDSVLNNDKIDDINITIKNDTSISAQDLQKIKNSKKMVKLNYYDENKVLLYCWIIDGSKLKDTNSLLSTISFETDNKKEILKLSNYADGLFVNLKHSDSLPDGTKLKVYIGNKYTDDDKVNVYYYDKVNNKLVLVGDGLSVNEGFTEFNVKNGLDYFVTMSKISNVSITVLNTNPSNVFIILIIVIFILVVGGIVVFFIMKKKKKYNKTNNYNN